MTRRRWVIAGTLAAVAALALIGAFVDDGNDDWHGRPTPGNNTASGPSRADNEAARAAREQLARVFAVCGDIHRAQRTEGQPLSRGPGPGIARSVTVTWEHRGVDFEPHPQPITQVETFNNVTWHGDVIVRYAAVRQARDGDRDALWRSGDPLVLRMQKRNGNWPPPPEVTALLKERWSPRC